MPPAAPPTAGAQAPPPPLGDRFASLLLTLASATAGVAGFALIIAGIALQSPPKAPVPAGLVAVGTLTALAAAAAAVGARRSRLALGVFLAFASLSALSQLALAAACLHSPARVAAAVIESDANGALAAVGSLPAATRARLLANRETAARATGAAFLILALAQLIGLAAAAALFVSTRVPWGARYAGLAGGAAGRAHGLELRGLLAAGGAGGGGVGGSKKAPGREFLERFSTKYSDPV